LNSCARLRIDIRQTINTWIGRLIDGVNRIAEYDEVQNDGEHAT
jgi:hypothetical protein